MIELICIDVDGTLLGSAGTVSDVIWTAASRARSRGVRIAVCSGRPGFGLSRQFAERLDARGWHAFQNGASVINLKDGNTRSHIIDPAIVTRLIAASRRTGRVLELYTDTDFVVEMDTDRTRRHAGLLGVPFRAGDLDALSAPIVRAQWLAAHDDVAAIMAEPIAGLAMLPSLSPVMADATFVNMTVSGVDKALAIGDIAAAYGFPLGHVMMVGDGANDVTALRLAGASVAMANAEPEAREAAQYSVGHVDRDGLLEAFALAERL